MHAGTTNATTLDLIEVDVFHDPLSDVSWTSIPENGMHLYIFIC